MKCIITRVNSNCISYWCRFIYVKDPVDEFQVPKFKVKVPAFILAVGEVKGEEPENSSVVQMQVNLLLHRMKRLLQWNYLKH